jgi:hypothetical protein
MVQVIEITQIVSSTMPTLAKNRFEQVDEIQPDALNLVLAQTGSGQDGRIVVPGSALESADAKDIDSGVMPAVDAFRSAVKLANELKLAIVVIDKGKIWRRAWGELYRDDGAE